jgi:HEAT repeat protein
MKTAVTTLLATLLLGTQLLAHGGIYTPPGDAGSGAGKSGGVVAPPTNPGGALAPVGNSASSGVARGTTGRGTSGRRSRGRRTFTSSGNTDMGPALDTWEFWWRSNQDRFLRLKERLDRRGAASGHLTLLTGRGNHQQKSSTRRPDAELVASVVVPHLIGLLDESEGDILDSALLALARSTGAGQADEVIASASQLLGHKELSVRSTAALSLGVVGDDAASGILIALLQDGSQGRKLVRGGAVPWLVRSFAALSLGLLGEDQGVVTLLDAVRRLPDSERDVKACAIVALGLIDSEHPRAHDIAGTLVELLQDRRLDPTIAAQIPTAIARQADPGAIVALLNSFHDRDSNRLVRQSTALAFGQLAVLDDEAVVSALIQEVERGRDSQTRHFALIALGQIGARSLMTDAGDLQTTTHKDLAALLARELSGKGKSRAHRPWAALAMALHTAPHRELQGPIIDRLLAALDDESDPSVRGSFTIALGLLEHRGSGERLLAEFQTCRDEALRGYIALALGLVGHIEAAESLRHACAVKGGSPNMRLQVALGLGLLADGETVGALIETLSEASTLGVASAAARALGMIGDRAAIEPLREVSLDERAQPITRGFAAVALGLLAEREDLPWNEAIRANSNYRAMVPALVEVADIP